MANIASIVQAIRQVIFGKDMRENIAKGIEAINTEVESTTARQVLIDANEALRILNENNRVGNEEARVTEHAQIVEDYNTYKNVMIAESNVAALQSEINYHTTQLAENTKLNITNTMQKMNSGEVTKIVCYGDSIFWGYQPSTAVQVANPFPKVLQEKLIANYSNNNITVYNEGHSGWQTDEALANLDSLVVAKNPDLVIIMFGINDERGSSFGSVTSISDYRNNITEIVKNLNKLNIEVLLLSPTPIIDTTNNNYKKLLIYAKVIQEIAKINNLAFINMQYEITKRFLLKTEAPSLLLPDTIHFTDDKYAMLADIIFGKMLDYNNVSDILTINNTQEIRIPAVNSPYIDTDCTVIATNSGQFFQSNYALRNTGTSGTYLKFGFYVDTPNMDLVLKAPKNTSGGQITVVDNGVNIKAIDYYMNETDAYEVEDTLITNMSLGYHLIEFLVSNSLKGQSTNPTYGNIYITDFLFRPSKTNQPANKFYNSVLAGSLGNVEMFNKINDGVLRFTSVATAQGNGLLLLNKEAAELKQGKTLVIEVEGKFFSGTGFTWFGNPARGALDTTNPSGVNTGYNIYFYGTGTNAVRLYGFGVNNNMSPLLQVTATIDYNVTKKIRITHTDLGVITVYLDGVQVIQVTDTKARTGWFGLYAYNPGTIEITRCEYAYI